MVRDGIDEFGDELVGFRDGRGLLDSSYIDLDIEEYERLGVLLGDPRA